MQTDIGPKDLANRKILVAGEAILDCYQEGTTSRVSREAPVPVVSSTKKSFRCGGAANACCNITAMGSEATLVSIVGSDNRGTLLNKLCDGEDVTCKFLPYLRNTPTKTRVLAAKQQMLRIDECEPQSEHAKDLAEQVVELLPGHDALLVSDYGLGAMEHAATMIDAAKAEGIPVVVDPRGRDWSRYRGASLVTPNLDELAAADGFVTETNEERARALMARHEIEAILLTLGAGGMTAFCEDSEAVTLPTRVAEVYDVTGAGDTVAAMMTLGLAAKARVEDAMIWANMAAGIVVGKFGASVVTAEELASEPGGHGGRVVKLDALLAKLSIHRSDDKRIVMTNGCFDIIHAGHLETLSAAARLGDLLVVCVNDDKSVKRLKGKDRPVVPIKDRLQLLAGLGCVDYALSFSGDDATDLVQKIAPDTYVKGGDWKKSPPPEAVAAEKLGANVVYMDLRTGLSTTNIIEKIKGDGA